ncbi:hypothetical protein ATE80_23580 [Streptomyces kanasensis]|uniref:Uncharacterized protein n=1 Tax=Streptomyces kanasensis TaxID=936756 RepID=A0A100Y2F4_9ACTN|nr:hypothetical protein ATE80_23580 [Streptomyces kanasensis]
MPGLAGQLADDRQHEHQVRGEEPQVPVGRVVVVDGDLHHQPVQRERARVVRHDQGAALGRDVLDAEHLHPEVLLVQGPQQRHEHLVGELLVVPELVDLVLAGEAAPQEGQAARDAPLPRAVGGPFGRRRRGVGGSRRRRARQRGHPRRGATGRRPPAGRARRTAARPVLVEGDDLGVRHR